MQATERPEFTPPTEGGLTRSIGLALLAHAVLALGLSWGVKWKRDDPVVTAEAELWANAPQQAAPKPVEAPPAPPPPPPAPPQPQQPTQAERDAEIALEKERERKEAEAKARREEAERQKQLAERKRQQEEARKEEARKEQARKADEKRKEEQARTRKQQEEDKRMAQMREENMKRMAGMAGATGPRESTGTALRSSGPSASYAGRLSALFQRNVVFPGGVDTIAGNPVAVVQVRVSPTGEILSAKLSRSSGNAAWDEAAVRAIERSERIPADVDGRYVSDFPVEMKPKR
ncbi:cell envelope integrity protein TolA [Ramlibacter sp. Leaf400]|uniref:cell envelope integrity protein TolA n=1 Tax=Ramlibacter sp. Leaf400 TaxID=1736365 RepID=UPI0006F49118|nr:cell envelope integrity protein TolA [Ramlibacter sp. Leaf400]KQT10364.1 hypothetical protein ASG30_11000 [Ramlibacter sp. Leaf400]